MSVKVVDNSRSVLIKMNRARNMALRLALEDIDRAAFPTTPKKSGELRKNVKKNVSGGTAKIKWPIKYAVYQERGYTSGPVRHYTTPGTGAHFAERAVRKVISRGFGHYLRRFL